MDYTKSATIMQTKFIIEWNNLLGVFNRVLFSIPNTDNLRVFILLINKINSNCQAAITLVSKGFINEGLMIFRSAIETVIFEKYLSLYPEEQEKFLYLSDLFLIKNQFIQYKEIKNNKLQKSPDIQILQQTIEENIRQLLKTNDILQKKFPSLVLKFDESDIKILDEFFKDRRHKFTPQKVHHLLEEIKKKESQFANTSFDLHDIYYAYYDENSAILHGNARYWNEEPQLNQYYLGIITSHLIRILVVATDIIKNEISETVYKKFELAVKKLSDLEITSFSK